MLETTFGSTKKYGVAHTKSGKLMELRIQTPIRIDATNDKVRGRGTTSAGAHHKYKPFTVLIHGCPNQPSNRQNEITPQQNMY